VDITVRRDIVEGIRSSSNFSFSSNLALTFHPFSSMIFVHLSSSLQDEENPKLMLRDMEPLFIEYKVNIVLSGHNHAYVRTYPMVGPNRRSLNNVRTTKANINPTDDAPIYLTIGTGGDSHSKGPLHPFPEEWVAHRDNVEYGFGDLIFINTTHAYLQRILNRGEDADPSANDEVWIRNYYFDDDEDNDYHHFSPNPVSSR